jgi:hypothetical protein
MATILGTKYFTEEPASRHVHKNDLDWYRGRLIEDGYIQAGLTWKHPTMDVTVVESLFFVGKGNYKIITVY